VAIEIWPQALAAKTGEIFAVELRLDASLGVSHLPCRVRFDPALVRFHAAQAGPLLQAGGTPQVLAHAAEDGLLVLGASLLGVQNGMSGGGTVMRLEFEALLPGASKIRLTQATPFGPELDGRRSTVGRRSVDVAVTPDIDVPKPGGEARAPGADELRVLESPRVEPDGAEPPRKEDVPW
jgi:hypothetical protein